jgi:hypothetical protein
VHASVASTLASAASLLRPFAYEDSSSASNASMFFWHMMSAAVAPENMGSGFPSTATVPLGMGTVPPVAMGGGVPPHVPVPMGGAIPLLMGSGVPAPVPVPMGGVAPFQVPVHIEGVVPPQAPFPVVSCHPPLATSMALIRTVESFKLPAMKDVKAYLDHCSIIQYYLRRLEFSTQRADDALVTDSQNLEASCFWEEQIRIAVQEGSRCFLFKNIESQFDGKGFEMLAALNQHCHPDLVANAFTMLMLLFNNNMTKSKDIMAFHSNFGKMVDDMAWCKIDIPHILLVIFSLWSLPPCYNYLLEKFWSQSKDLESASLDSIVADVCYHDEFKLVGSDKKSLAGKMPRAATAATNVNKQGKQWNNPFEWLSMLHVNSFKKQWKCALAGNGICLLCHR